MRKSDGLKQYSSELPITSDESGEGKNYYQKVLEFLFGLLDARSVNLSDTSTSA